MKQIKLFLFKKSEQKKEKITLLVEKKNNNKSDIFKTGNLVLRIRYQITVIKNQRTEL